MENIEEMETIEEIIDTTFPGASTDIFRNDTSGFIGGRQNDGWDHYLQSKSQKYQQQDYEAYYDNIYEPYLELSEKYPKIVDDIQTACKEWSNGQIGGSGRLYEYLLNIINIYEKKSNKKKWGDFSSD